MAKEEEKDEVNDTGEGEEEEFVTPTIDPVTGEVKEPEDTGEEGGKKEEEGGTWEERYKNLQSQKDKEVKDAQGAKEAAEKELQRHKDLLTPYRNNIKETDDGRLSFDFSDTPSKKEDEKPPEPATEEEWDDNPKEAAKKDRAVERYQERKEREKEKEEQDTSSSAEEANETYWKARGESHENVLKLYPDFGNEESELFKKAAEWLANHPAVAQDPECDLIAIEKVAKELGISPAESSENELGEKVDKGKGTYVIGGKSGSGGTKGKKKELTEAEFKALKPEEQEQYMKESVGLG